VDEIEVVDVILVTVEYVVVEVGSLQRCEPFEQSRVPEMYPRQSSVFKCLQTPVVANLHPVHNTSAVLVLVVEVDVRDVVVCDVLVLEVKVDVVDDSAYTHVAFVIPTCFIDQSVSPGAVK
jgi:hypothetical protein